MILTSSLLLWVDSGSIQELFYTGLAFERPYSSSPPPLLGGPGSHRGSREKGKWGSV